MFLSPPLQGAGMSTCQKHYRCVCVTIVIAIVLFAANLFAANIDQCDGINVSSFWICDNIEDCQVTKVCKLETYKNCDNCAAGNCKYMEWGITRKWGKCNNPFPPLPTTCTNCTIWWCASGQAAEGVDENNRCINPKCDIVRGYAGCVPPS